MKPRSRNAANRTQSHAIPLVGQRARALVVVSGGDAPTTQLTQQKFQIATANSLKSSSPSLFVSNCDDEVAACITTNCTSGQQSVSSPSNMRNDTSQQASLWKSTVAHLRSRTNLKNRSIRVVGSANEKYLQQQRRVIVDRAGLENNCECDCALCGNVALSSPITYAKNSFVSTAPLWSVSTAWASKICE